MTDSKEFGGRVGALSLMIFSHFILYYMFYCVNLNNGNLFFPTTITEVSKAFELLYENCMPNLTSILIYFLFLIVEAVFAVVLPGLELLGRPGDDGHRLKYNCNALMSWYASLAIVLGLQIYGLYNDIATVSILSDILGKLMTTAIIFADALSIVLYLSGFILGITHRMSGDHIYDFFMGSILHPRIGTFDIKFWAEIRISWFILFMTTLSCAFKQFEVLGMISPSMGFMVLAHFLYANACAKGEHYVPTTWDIFYEKFGWMLTFWNFAGVPFLYVTQSAYILRQSIDHDKLYPQSTYFIILMTIVLFIAYYFWDSAQSQKNHFRLEFMGVKINRNTFPQMPWNKLTNPKYIKTEFGTPLLTDGWWAYARKIHYTADIVMALLWGLSCGFDHWAPYFYVCFFTGMIVHRNGRDIDRCAKKYGADWVRYTNTVPYVFIPGIY
jgi:delta24(24(1))-sterol reductase